MLVIYGIYATYSGGALADMCEPKKVNSGYWCTPKLKCAPGCFCTGNTNSNYSTDIWEGIGYYNTSMHPFATCGGCIFNGVRKDFETLCKIHFKNFKQNKASSYSEISTALDAYLREKKDIYINNLYDKLEYSEELANSLGIFSCPSQYPESDAGAKSAEDCYASANGQKVYNKTLNCKAGQYLPRNSSSCTACKTGERYYCPGGSFHTSTSHDMGLKIKCEAGQYLPKNSSSCTACKTSNRYYVCAGGTFTTYSSSDLGIKKCTGGLVANDGRTACQDSNGNTVTQSSENTSATIHVPEGMYLQANQTEPVSCTGATKYCPGGEFEKASVEQGRYDCPLNGRANSDKTACVVSVSKTWMQYGPLGTNTPYKRQCWHQADALDPGRYIACVLSGRYYR